MPERQWKQYALRTICLGHHEDVRGLTSDGSCFISASRDRTVKIWKETGANSYTNTLTLVGHRDYVGAVAVKADQSQKEYVSGSRDKTIRVWDDSGKCLRVLEGHKWQVTALLVREGGCVVSASLDGTIRKWNEVGEATVLEGHEGPVQCLALLPDGTLLSGSNDKTIRCWEHGACVKTIIGHEDTVRGLAVVHGLGFVSASHDTTLRIWTADGDSIATLVGHSALVYSAAVSGSGLIASASEDTTVRLWQTTGSCIQVIPHSACVWDVTFLPNGDLVTACADFAAYVWSAHEARAATTEQQAAYSAAIEARNAAAEGSAESTLPEGLKVEDAMILSHAGSRDGQTVVVREEGSAVAYSWSQNRCEWEKLGEVVGGPQDTMAVGNKQHANKTWDYVFDVDISDGAPVKKLAANRGEDPYTAADRFLEMEQLPLSYREQIARFIVDNSNGGITFTMPTLNTDPFTGGASYVPTGRRNPVPGDFAYQSTGGGADPFTGGHVSTKTMPQMTYTTFTAMPKLDALASKVRDFSLELGKDHPACLSCEESATGGTLDALLASIAKSPGRTGPSLAEQQLLNKLLRWPSAQLFPVLDIVRLLALDLDHASALADAGGLDGAMATAMEEPQSHANQQTALQLACNAFLQPPLRAWVRSQIPVLLDGFATALNSPSKSVRLGYCTLLLNCSVLQDTDESIKMQVLSALNEILGNNAETDSEITLRTLTATGTLLAGDSRLCSTAREVGFVELLLVKEQMFGGKVASVAKEFQQILR